VCVLLPVCVLCCVLIRAYQTLPASFSKLPPGRDFLKRYLETTGYLPPAEPGKDGAAADAKAAAAAQAAGKGLLNASNVLGPRRPSGAAVSPLSPAKEPLSSGIHGPKAGAGAGAAVTPAPAAAGKPGAAAPVASPPSVVKKPGDKPDAAPATTAAAAGAKPAETKSAAVPTAAAGGAADKAGKPVTAAPAAAPVATGGPLLTQLADLCNKFADQKNSQQWKQPLYDRPPTRTAPPCATRLQPPSFIARMRFTIDRSSLLSCLARAQCAEGPYGRRSRIGVACE
jgi:hypothetical protein